MRLLKPAFAFVICAALILQVVTITAQTRTSTTKPGGETKKTDDTAKASPKGKTLSPAEKRSYDLLIATLDQSDQIADTTDRSEIVAPAAMLVWKFDEQISRAWLKRIVDSLFDEYERHDDKESRARNQDAIKDIAKLIASRDSTLSLAIIDKLDELKQKYAAAKSNSPQYRADRLSIAEEAIGSDSTRATQIAAETVGSGIPSAFPGFLYKLAETSPATADALFRQTLAVLSTGSIYRLNDAINLSVYAFKESQLVTPTVDQSDGKNSYGTYFQNPYTTRVPGLDAAIANDYLNATNSYLTSVLGPGGQGIKSDLLTLGQCFYLVNKLGFYAGYFNPSSNNSWQQLRARVLELMNAAGVEPGSLSNQTAFADRIAKGESPFQDDGGVADFEKADKTADKTERDRYLSRGIITLIEHQKFDEADKKIQKISDTTSAERLRNYLDLSAGEAAIRRSDWSEVQSRTAHLSDTVARIYLLLKAAEAAVKAPKNTKAAIAELLSEATRLTDKLDASDSKTKMQIVAAGIFYKSGDTIRGGQVLASAVRELNGPKPFTDKQSYFTFELPAYSFGLVIGEWDFDSSFKEAASKDWEGALMLIEGIQLPRLRLSAQIAAAQATPSSKPSNAKDAQTSH